MEENYLLKLTFWGVRGSTPTPRIENLAFGGNTSCLEVQTGEGEVLIFDAGTGITPLGWHLVEKGNGPLDVKIFMTHFHWDHTQGIPFFQPLYSADNKVTFFSFENRAEDMLKGQMTEPYFPISFDFLPAQLEFHPIGHSPFKIGGVEISPFPMNHPQGATGYRIEREGKGIVYASDHEHGDSHLDASVRNHAADARVLVYDAQYTPEEYQQRLGWGHSTWLEAARVATDAAVDQLILFHHDPAHDDIMMTDIIKEARLHFAKVHAASEGEFFIL